MSMDRFNVEDIELKEARRFCFPCKGFYKCNRLLHTGLGLGGADDVGNWDRFLFLDLTEGCASCVALFTC